MRTITSVDHQMMNFEFCQVLLESNQFTVCSDLDLVGSKRSKWRISAVCFIARLCYSPISVRRPAMRRAISIGAEGHNERIPDANASASAGYTFLQRRTILSRGR